jgi:hypothetical protein
MAASTARSTLSFPILTTLTTGFCAADKCPCPLAPGLRRRSRVLHPALVFTKSLRDRCPCLLRIPAGREALGFRCEDATRDEAR